jgi:hypothetical protein
MLDIVRIEDGFDLGFGDTATVKAANVLSVQLGALEYAPNFGVDFRFFLQSDFQFQNESFKSYLIERLTQHQINVGSVTEVLESLYGRYIFKVGDAQQKAEGFIL